MIPDIRKQHRNELQQTTAQRPKLTGNKKRRAQSEKQNTTTRIGEQNDDEIAVRIKMYKNLPRSKSKEASNSKQ